MTVVSDLSVSWITIPLGGARGGSGATKVDLMVVRITDTEGAEGTGFTYALTGGSEALHALLTGTLQERVVGCALDHWPRCYEEVLQAGHRLGRGVVVPALSAVDIAVWDLRARRAGLPMYRFLGAHSDQVPVYGSGRSTNEMSIEELVEGTKSYIADGYGAVKLRVGGRPAEEDAARVRAVREAVDDSVRLMVDCNERLDLPTAQWMARKLAELDVYWMEEPLRSDDIVGHAALAGRTGMSIAVGEHLHGRFEFAAYLRQGAASVLQPDVPLTGGITEWLRISAVAEVFGAVLSPHLLPELHVHLATAVPNCVYIEHFPLIDDVLAETVAVVGGVARPPDRPGHGLKWDESALDRLRFR